MDTKIQKKLEEFFTQFKHQIYKKGEFLIRADDTPQGIFYLQKGFVKEYAISKRGDELMVNIFKPISFFPMSWAINNTPNPYYYKAMTKVKVWRAPREKTLKFIKNHPDILFDLTSRIYKGMDGLLTRMIYLMAGNAYARVILELIIQTKRFGMSYHSTERDLASQSGMTRETVSREMKILKEKGIVEFRKNVLFIKNLQKLENELTEEDR